VNLTQSVLSTEYVSIGVSFTVANNAIDPTGDDVSFAFCAPGVEPASGDWHAGSWAEGGPPYLAQFLVGPSGQVTLTAGTWEVWIKVQDTPEVPVKHAATLTIR
jgi:hypothetical protein